MDKPFHTVLSNGEKWTSVFPCLLHLTSQLGFVFLQGHQFVIVYAALIAISHMAFRFM